MFINVLTTWTPFPDWAWMTCYLQACRNPEILNMRTCNRWDICNKFWLHDKLPANMRKFYANITFQNCLQILHFSGILDFSISGFLTDWSLFLVLSVWMEHRSSWSLAGSLSPPPTPPTSDLFRWVEFWLHLKYGVQNSGGISLSFL